jgi:PemK-like, MazF-like toxin of type II toxin-antitoxin system
MDTDLHWPEPMAGDIVWCHFPDNIHPRPKPRPALVMTVFDGDDTQFVVSVVYGTSQKTTALRRGEFAILKAMHPAAYEAAGLSYDTKFDLKQMINLAYIEAWFSVPPAAPYGKTPKLGILHPAMVRALEAAYRAANQ